MPSQHSPGSSSLYFPKVHRHFQDFEPLAPHCITPVCEWRTQSFVIDAQKQHIEKEKFSQTFWFPVVGYFHAENISKRSQSRSKRTCSFLPLHCASTSYYTLRCQIWSLRDQNSCLPIRRRFPRKHWSLKLTRSGFWDVPTKWNSPWNPNIQSADYKCVKDVFVCRKCVITQFHSPFTVGLEHLFRHRAQELYFAHFYFHVGV